MIKYCQVIVNAKTSSSPPEGYTYGLNQNLSESVQIGHLVLVPFGRRLTQGLVISFSSNKSKYKIKYVQQIIGEKPLLNQNQVQLALFISKYYFCSPGQAVFALIPSFIAQSIVKTYQVSKENNKSLSQQNNHQIIDFIRQSQDPISEKIIHQKFGSITSKELSLLVKKGLIQKKYQLLPPKVNIKFEEIVSLNNRSKIDLSSINSLKQKSILEFLKYRQSATWSQIKQALKLPKSILLTLSQKKLISIKKERVIRIPEMFDTQNLVQKPKLTNDQTLAWKEINYQFKQSEPKPVLLFGRTGSGKTELYLRAAAKAIKEGRGVIMLVPEIALLPQTILRFLERFGDKLAIYHSHMSLGERYDQWFKIYSGQANIVIGSRSALFTPIRNLGLIMIDEEHEFSYKQDMTPRYHAVTVAEKYSQLTNSLLILGSATPRLETFWRAKKGQYKLLKLSQTITELNNPDRHLRPQFYLVDLRDEFSAHNKSLLSYSLQAGIKQALAEKKQILLFLNRRGHATYVFCRECGYIANCANCHIPLTYHLNQQQDSLICHHCGLQSKNLRTCPQCSGTAIKYYGAGTEKLHLETSQLFPEAKIIRMDHDTTQTKDAHHKIFSAFRSHQADILIGTQMIAKGWDLPNVDLIGIINADAGFNLPDFRSTERNFALLLQLIGRVGRGQSAGKVYLQTFDPDNPLLETLMKEDYQLFAFSELIERQKSLFPPFVDLIRLIYESSNINQCQINGIKVFKIINQVFIEQKNKDLRAILGPSPAFLSKIKNHYRWHIILKGHNLQQFLPLIPVDWTIDVDPYSIL